MQRLPSITDYHHHRCETITVHQQLLRLTHPIHLTLLFEASSSPALHFVVLCCAVHRPVLTMDSSPPSLLAPRVFSEHPQAAQGELAGFIATKGKGSHNEQALRTDMCATIPRGIRHTHVTDTVFFRCVSAIALVFCVQEHFA